MNWNQKPTQSQKSWLLRQWRSTSMPRSGWPRRNRDAGRTGPRSEGQIRTAKSGNIDLRDKSIIATAIGFPEMGGSARIVGQSPMIGQPGFMPKVQRLIYVQQFALK